MRAARVVALLGALALLAAARVRANDFETEFEVLCPNGSPVAGATLSLFGCVDGAGLLGSTNGTGRVGFYKFSPPQPQAGGQRDIQYCFGSGQEYCGWSVALPGVPTAAPFDGPTTLVDVYGNPASPQQLACGCATRSCGGCCNPAEEPRYPLITLTLEDNVPGVCGSVCATPTVSVSGPEEATQLAAGATSATFTFTVSSGVGGPPLTVGVSASPGASVSCAVSGPSTVPSGADAAVVCSGVAGAPLPASFSLTASAAAGAAPCLGSGSRTASVTVAPPPAGCPLGSSETAYARGSGASAPTCFRAGGCGNWGWSNRFTGDGVATADLVAGAGNGACGGGSRVGSLAVACTTSGGSSTVMLSSPAQTIVAGAPVTPHFFLGCAAPARCTPPRFGAARTAVCSAASSTACGGNIPAVLSGPLTFSIGCPCASVHWVFHESSDGFTSACPV